MRPPYSRLSSGKPRSNGNTPLIFAIIGLVIIFAVAIPLIVVFATRDTCIHLRQSDFDTGTYRIRTPHRCYILDEDINFEPTSTREDIPIAGWFAVISVETDDIRIDLNGHTIQATEAYLAQHFFFVFSGIELTNSPFPGPLFGLIGANYAGDTEFVGATNVEVKNGNLKRSSHWNIHGNNCANIHLHHLHTGDFEVASIQINGVANLTIHDILITGIEHTIQVSAEKVVSQTHLQYLQYLMSIDYPGADAQYTALSNFIDARPDLFNQTHTRPTNSIYGMFFTSGFPSLLPFPLTPELCAVGAFIAGGRTVENVHIRDVVIRNITNAPQSFPVIGSSTDITFAFQPSLLALPVAGAPRWLDAFDDMGNFAPNPFLVAAVFIVNSQIELNPGFTGALPSNYAEIADSILNANVTKFLENTFPILGVGIEGLGNTGTFGLRLDCSVNSTVTNVTVDGLRNFGPAALELKDIPYGNTYNASLFEFRYGGNDIWGFEFSSNDGDVYDRLVSNDIQSIWGNSFGLDMAESVANVLVSDCNSTSTVSVIESNTTSIVNPPPVAYGFRTKNSIGAVDFHDCYSDSVIAKRNAFGFAAEQSIDVFYRRVVSLNVNATTSVELDSVDHPVEAFGFYQTESNNTLYECVTARRVFLTGTNTSGPSTAVASGIHLEDGFDTVINNPSISEISAGTSGGTAENIHDGSVNTVFLNEAC